MRSIVCEASLHGKPNRRNPETASNKRHPFLAEAKLFLVDSSTCYACRVNPTTAAEWIASGYQARREQRPDEARNCFSRALNLCRITDDKLHKAQAHAGLGQIERDRRNIGAALKHYQIAVELLRKQDDPLALAHTIRHVADILRGEGNLEPAQRHYEEALAIYYAHETTPPLDLANALRGYALLMEQCGKNEEATMLWRQAHALYDQLEIGAGVTESQSHLAFLMGR
jgi:tetratricopeptide (TPR) repeat protein